MAFIDDPEFVIAHIRHSCVVTDDTGELCKLMHLSMSSRGEEGGGAA